MTTPRTIDNLGVDVSTRYAQDESLRLQTPFEAGVTKRAEIDVTVPIQSEFEVLFGGLTKASTWADFSPPEGYYARKTNLFSTGVAPRLGTNEEIDLKMSRVKEIGGG